MEPRETNQEKIQEIVEQIRSCKAEISWLEAYLCELKGKLWKLLEENGESWSDGKGYARIISVEEHALLDADALSNLIAKNPVEYGWLKGYYRVSSTSNRIQVK